MLWVGKLSTSALAVSVAMAKIHRTRPGVGIEGQICLSGSLVIVDRDVRQLVHGMPCTVAVDHAFLKPRSGLGYVAHFLPNRFQVTMTHVCWFRMSMRSSDT